VVEDDFLAREILLLHAAGEVKLRVRATSLHDESGVVHVRDDAERFPTGRAVFVNGVEIAKFIESRGEVGQILQPFEKAAADMRLVARRGRTRRHRHERLVKFFVEDVHRNRE
jgi:hypothetical protein